MHETRGSKNRKSSTVYLNAEEKRIPDGEQQSIVDGQIKRLISIRDDALDARAKADEMDEAKVLNFKREVEPEEREIRSGDEVSIEGKFKEKLYSLILDGELIELDWKKKRERFSNLGG